MTPKKISPKQKRVLLDELQTRGVSLHGDKGKMIEMLINCADLLNNVDDFLSVIELGLIPAKLGIIGIALGPISNMIAIAKAKEAGYKLFEHKAISYTSTAWAFNHTPLPPLPPKKDLIEAKKWKGNAEERKYSQVWRTASQATLQKLKQKKELRGKSLKPENYKLLLRYMSNNDPHQLAYSIWTSFKNRFSSSQDRSQFKYYSNGIIYPN